MARDNLQFSLIVDSYLKTTGLASPYFSNTRERLTSLFSWVAGGCMFATSSVVLWLMKAHNYKLFSVLSGIVMLFILLWLSVGISFVYLVQQKKVADKICAGHNIPMNPDEDACPFEDTEEGSETSSNSFSTEYLQEDYEGLPGSNTFLKHDKSRYNNGFIFFPIESISQPPDSLS